MRKFNYLGFIFSLVPYKFLLDGKKVWKVFIDLDEFHINYHVNYSLFNPNDLDLDYDLFPKYMGKYFGDFEQLSNKLKSYVDIISLYIE